MADRELLPNLQRAAADALRKASDPEVRTESLREAAKQIVAARRYFYTQDGTPDWAGRSYAYRQWIHEVRNLAGGPADSLMTALRYHVSSVLREDVPADDLEAAGLHVVSIREKNVDLRAKRTATLALVSPGPDLTEVAEIEAALEAVENALLRISLSTLRSLPAEDRADIAKAVDQVFSIAGEVHGAVHTGE